MTLWSREFSMPCESSNEAIFETIAATHAGSVAGWLLDRFDSDIEAASEGVTQALAEWTTSTWQTSFATVWDISFGRAHLVMKGERLDPAGVAARLALRVAEMGHSGRWNAGVHPQPMIFAGALVEDVIHVAADITTPSQLVVLTTAGGDRFEFRRDTSSDAWARSGEVLTNFGASSSIALLPGRALPRDAGSREVFGECSPVGSIDPQMQWAFQAGMDMLSDLTPQYVPWVERVLHGVVVCAVSAPYRLVSGSWEDVPGFIHLSYPHIPIDVADILVHESAHQYFYLLQRVGPVDDGSDTTLHWSPPMGTGRPLSRILMAFHALVNVLCLYDAVRRCNTPDVAYIEANEPALLDAIRGLDEPLRNNPALTDLGRSIYEPLAEQMISRSR